MYAVAFWRCLKIGWKKKDITIATSVIEWKTATELHWNNLKEIYFNLILRVNIFGIWLIIYYENIHYYETGPIPSEKKQQPTNKQKKPLKQYKNF